MPLMLPSMRYWPLGERDRHADWEADEQRFAEADAIIKAATATDPVAQWFNRATKGYWEFAVCVANYFPLALSRLKGGNPYLAMLSLTLITITGFAIVPPLYLIIGPLV